MINGYAIILHGDTTPDLLAILSGYVRKKDSLKYILSRSIEIGHQFTALEVIRDKNDSSWKISIPTHAIVAIVELDAGELNFGFVS